MGKGSLQGSLLMSSATTETGASKVCGARGEKLAKCQQGFRIRRRYARQDRAKAGLG
jgi:hypothetical protein